MTVTHLNKKNKNTVQKGFTLIELLIVIAILGVLAAVVLVAVNPLEQLAKGRDSGRKSSIAQLGRAIQGYYTTNSALPAAATWNTVVTTSGDVKVFPTNPAGVTACTNNIQSGFCYSPNAGGTDYIVYSHLESKSEASKCAGTVANTWYVYSSADGKAGTYCNATEPTGATAPFGALLLP